MYSSCILIDYTGQDVILAFDLRKDKISNRVYDKRVRWVTCMRILNIENKRDMYVI